MMESHRTSSDGLEKLGWKGWEWRGGIGGRWRRERSGRWERSFGEGGRWVCDWSVESVRLLREEGRLCSHVSPGPKKV